jgi:hypothetical protein
MFRGQTVDEPDPGEARNSLSLEAVVHPSGLVSLPNIDAENSEVNYLKHHFFYCTVVLEF